MQLGSPNEGLRSRRNHHVQPLWMCAAARSLAATLLLAPIPAAASGPPPSKPSEYDVKAAYLLNFGNFVRLPGQASVSSSFNICTLGHDSMESSLDSLAANSAVNGRPVHINHLQDITDAKPCAIVFISSSETDRLREDLAILGNADILTVSDAPDFLQHGGMIQFVLISNHVRFAVNLDAVNHTHLSLSSELLRVASSISGKPPTGELP